MEKGKWEIKKAKDDDIKRWFTLSKSVKSDFCGLDLSEDDGYRAGMIKNMQRGTAIYIEDSDHADKPIIGAMTYSPRSNHISWLAVHSDYRRRHIASALMTYALDELSFAEEVKVKTFLYDDAYGKAARGFYKSFGFDPREALMKEEGYPHPVQVFVRSRSKRGQ